MGKSYKVDMILDVKDLTDGGGMKFKAVDKAIDPRGIQENTGAEVFALIAGVAINGAYKKCSYAQLKAYRKIVTDLNAATKVCEYMANKTDLDIIKAGIKGNPGWPNQDEIMGVLDQILFKIEGAIEMP